MSNPYDLTPTHWNGNDLTASPFASVLFDPTNGPMQNDWRSPVEASIIGVGDRHVRSQAKGANWDLHIELTSTLETDRLQLARVFSGEPGQVYLRAKDGDNNTLRALVMLIELERVDANHFIAHTRVADARWEDNDLQTTGATYNNKSGDSVAINAIVNAGDKRARPTLTVTPLAVKAIDPGIDFMTMERGFSVNRSPKPLVDYDVDVTDVAAASNPYNTAALIKVAGTSNLLNEAAGITDVFTGVAHIDTPAGGGLLQPAGIAIFDDGANQEQVYYIAATATQIQIVTRGVGGTAARAWPNNTPVYLSWMLKDGSDLRVWMNGAWVERWLGGLNSSVTRIWVPMSAPARKKMTGIVAATAGSPANGGSLQVQEDISDMADSGVLAWEQELIGYSAKNNDTRTFTGIQRAVWTSRGAAVHAVTVPIYRVDNLFAIAFGRVGLAPPMGDPSLDRRPAHQLKSSQNNSWRYGDESDDPNTVFYDAARPNRLSMFQPDYTIDPNDKNNAIPLQLVVAAGVPNAQFKDSLPAAGKLQVGRLRLVLPVPVKPAASAITYDAQKQGDLRLRLIGQDESGMETVLADLIDLASGFTSGATVTPLARLTSVVLNGIRAAVAGSESQESYFQMAPTDHIYSKLVLDEDTQLDSIYLSLQKIGTPTNNFNVEIMDSSGATPSAGVKRVHFNKWSGDASTINFPLSVLSNAAYNWYRFYSSDASIIFLPAGTYWIRVFVLAGGAGNMLLIQAGQAQNKHGSSSFLGGAIGQDNFRFRAIHTGGGPIQIEMGLINLNAGAYFDKLIFNLDDTAADPYTPYVDRESTAVPSSHNIYHCIGRLTNAANGKYFDIDMFMKHTFSLAIDTLAHSVVYTEGNWLWSLRGVVAPGDASEWCPLEPGSNNLTYAEGKMLNTSLLLTHRGKRG